jgi:FixJ family two-component response regulator
MYRDRYPSATVDIVDCDRACFDALTALVRGKGATLRYCATGREALRVAKDGRTVVWVIGVELPDMTGFDLHEMLGNRCEGAAVCMLASEYRMEDEVRAYRMGATMYACKPVEASWLKECIEQLHAEFAARHHVA